MRAAERSFQYLLWRNTIPCMTRVMIIDWDSVAWERSWRRQVQKNWENWSKGSGNKVEIISAWPGVQESNNNYPNCQKEKLKLCIYVRGEGLRYDDSSTHSTCNWFAATKRGIEREEGKVEKWVWYTSKGPNFLWIDWTLAAKPSISGQDLSTCYARSLSQSFTHVCIRIGQFSRETQGDLLNPCQRRFFSRPKSKTDTFPLNQMRLLGQGVEPLTGDLCQE